MILAGQLHTKVCLILLLVLMAIFISFLVSLATTHFGELEFDSQKLEYYWTLTPAVILLVILWPSINLIYDVATTRFSPAFGAWPIVVIGHQWY
jgi:heme/copper-type cytochrome/quinol oxidase subunit 2